MIQFNLQHCFTVSEPQLHLGGALRSFAQPDALQLKLDSFEGADCLFLRAEAPARLQLDGNYTLQRCTAGGWLLASKDPSVSSYWLPTAATLRRVSNQGHILEERAAEVDEFDLDTSGVAIAFASIPGGWTLDATVWRLNDAELIGDLQTLAPIETQGYFLLGSHTRYGQPADLYRHLVHGWVYEDRYAWPHKRRICSENDAHALYLIFNSLQHTTGKRIYALLKAQLLLSVLSRQSEDGGFRHGEWTDGMESHYRLHCSALHLIMDALTERGDVVIRAALARGMAFISDKHDATDAGVWFYHDELEMSEAGMRNAPFKWWPSRALGKSPQNMLVLNTQLDTLVALERYGTLTGDTQYAPLVELGLSGSACGAGTAPGGVALPPNIFGHRPDPDAD